MKNSYLYYKNILSPYPKPLAFLDKNLLDENIAAIISRNPSVKMRVASKSVRCIEVLKYILKTRDHFEGIMSFSASETVFLLEKGLDNILLGYPVVNQEQIHQLCEYIRKGKKVIFMSDLQEHVKLISDIAGQYQISAEICLDIDMSSRFPFLYFGVYRSSLNSLKKIEEIATFIKTCPNTRLSGIMGYESQIAGLADNVPGESFKNLAIRYLKNRSLKDIRRKRKEAIDYLKSSGFELNLVNAGGTGSLESSATEPWVTEITVGSGFYSSHLFDNYSGFKHQPAVAFVLDITRRPAEKLFTCAGGGYTASGATDKNKLPKPYLPEGLKLIKNEGAGEVQTPFRYEGDQQLKVGDPVIMRHSKAGEVCERFNELYIIADGKITDIFPTYRGEGECFM